MKVCSVYVSSCHPIRWLSDYSYHICKIGYLRSLALLMVEPGLNFVNIFQVDVEIATHITIFDDGPDRRCCLVETHIN